MQALTNLTAPQRARYHASMIDTKILEPGENYNNLKESYIIFITENDYFKQGKPMYHIDRIVGEIGLPFEDFQHIIYVNGQYKSEDPLGQLIHDFWCTSAKEIKSKVLRDYVGYYKDNKEGTAAMCRSLEEMRKETALRRDIEMIQKILAKGKTPEEIIAFCEYPEELVYEVAGSVLSNA